MLYIKALVNGEYADWTVPPGYSRIPRLVDGLRLLNASPELWGGWDMLRIEDRNGRILARKERWNYVQIWNSEKQQWRAYIDEHTSESEAADGPTS